MPQITITVGDDEYLRLQEIAVSRKESVAELLADSARGLLQGDEPEEAVAQPIPRSLGIVSSGFTDTGRLSGDAPIEPTEWR